VFFSSFFLGRGGERVLGDNDGLDIKGVGLLPPHGIKHLSMLSTRFCCSLPVLLCSNGLNSLLTVLVVPSMKFQRELIVESRYWIFYLTRRLMLTGLS